MIYQQDSGSTYSFSYRVVKEDYDKFCNMSDAEFIKALPEALHLACFIAYVKELGPESTIADEGIIHELVHLLTATGQRPLADIRADFKAILRLA